MVCEEDVLFLPWSYNDNLELKLRIQIRGDDKMEERRLTLVVALFFSSSIGYQIPQKCDSDYYGWRILWVEQC